MSLLRGVLLVLMIGFAALIVWAIMVGDFWAEGDWLVSNPWGIVSLIDLYIGFFLSALVIAAFERPRVALLWILPIPFLGNVWTLAWFIIRMPTLWRQLRARHA